MNDIYILQLCSESSGRMLILAPCTTTKIAVDLMNKYLSDMPDFEKWKKLYEDAEVEALVMKRFGHLICYQKTDSGGYRDFLQIKMYPVNEIKC